jgi:hypothetical protein
MPINPLELQTNFSQINQVGKQVSTIKENESIKEDQINTLIQKNSEKESEDIPTTKDLTEGPEKIKDEPGKKNEKKKKKKKVEIDVEVEDEKKVEDKKDDSLKNPDLGTHIDIIG